MQEIVKMFKDKLLILALLILLAIILSACAGGAAEEPAEEPAAPEEPTAPEEPVEPSDQYPVQYGQDSRTELFQHSDSRLKEMAASVAIFVHSSQVQVEENAVTISGYTLNEMSEMGWLVNGKNVPMCSEELFTSQLAPGFCTGFLVSEDILVTAGHCLQKASCTETEIIFGYQLEPDNSLATLTRDNVFNCAKVLAQEIPNQNNQYLDYAVIKLDRPTGRAGLEYAIEDLLESQNNVAVLGHPSGLPMKIASDAFILSNEANNPYFVTNLDTFGSNSGSPVINTATYKVEGILVRGEVDYVLSDDGSCVQVNRCPEEGSGNCAGENATKMAMLSEQISESTAEVNCFPGLSLAFILVVLARLKIS